MPAGSSTTTPRFDLPLHLMRGMAIFLIVLTHALGALQDGSAIGVVSVAVTTAILSFTLPLFFFISGFVSVRIFHCSSQDVRQVIARQTQRLMAVYFFYTGVAIVAKLAAASYVNRPVELSTLSTTVLLYPYANPLLDLWFIYALFMIQMLFIALRVVAQVNYCQLWQAVTMLVLLGVANGFSRLISPDTILGLHAVARYALYFGLGFLASRCNHTLQDWLRQYQKPLLVAGCLYLLYAYFFPSTLRTSWSISLFGALMGILLVWTLAIYLAETPGKLTRAISQLAHYSYEIYLNEGFFQEAAKITIVKLLGWHTLLIFPSGLLTGLLIPIALSKFLFQKFAYLRRYALGDWRS